jgi:hypothetical protein
MNVILGLALLHKSAARISEEAGRRLEGGLRLGHAEPSHRVHCREARIDLSDLTVETAVRTSWLPMVSSAALRCVKG